MSGERGQPAPVLPCVYFGERVAGTQDSSYDNGVILWHDCEVQGGWVASSHPNHTRHDEPRCLDKLTLRASVIWPDCCGMHGFITDGVWVGV